MVDEVFVDTSAIFALLVQDDRRHAEAVKTWNDRIAHTGAALFTTNYVVAESFDLARRRIRMEGVRAVDDFVRSSMDVVFVDVTQHDRARKLFFERNRRHLSLVDCVSFTVLRDRSSRNAFAYDDDFVREGFATM